MTLEAVIGEVVRLAMASGLGLPFVVVGIILVAVLIVGLRAVGFRWPSLKGESGPPPENSENPDAGGSTLVDGAGNPIKPGEPGGGPTGGMG